ncbi:acyl-CoA dehydrogenase family protein [Actinomadura darangshiensis]|uniref:acyl-CoA dehydrogenase family protein n=1 Tax=Actinomadura darangshiensis TaxID=705336 RepID=UPI00140CB434|nr:acyl-CoA dehydrogenase family protein [Actinomadura darangshiensis]
MHDGAVEAELRREVRKARAAGPVAARIATGADPRLARRWRRLGLLHAGLPESLGGAGGDPALAFAVAEECARDLLTPCSQLTGLWAVRTLAALAGDSEAARAELARVLEGDVPAVCWPGGAGRGPEVHWRSGRLSGRLSAVAPCSTPPRLLLVAPGEDNGVRIGLVELDRAEFDQAGRLDVTGIDPTRPAAVLALSEAPVRELGDVAPGEARRLRAFWLLVAAADCLGAMHGNLELATAHVRAREAFGRPIGAFQAVRHRCVDLYVDVEMKRAAVAGAGAAWARGDEDALADALVAVSHAADAQVRVAESAVLLHGALGFAYECDAQFYLRRAYGVQASLPSVRDLRIELATA